MLFHTPLPLMHVSFHGPTRGKKKKGMTKRTEQRIGIKTNENLKNTIISHFGKGKFKSTIMTKGAGNAIVAINRQIVIVYLLMDTSPTPISLLFLNRISPEIRYTIFNSLLFPISLSKKESYGPMFLNVVILCYYV